VNALLGVTISSDLSLDNSTLPMFVLLASSDYDNSVASDDHSTLSRAAATLSCHPVCITAIQFLPRDA